MEDVSLTQAPSDAEATIARLRAEAALRARHGDFADALLLYRQALGMAPQGRVDLYDDLGHLALQMGEATVSEGFFRQSLALNPNCTASADGLAQALCTQNRYKEAVDILKAALLATPEEAGLWNTLGVVMTGEGDSDRALVFFNEALRLAPDFAIALYHRAGAAMDQGQVAAALGDCDAALAALAPEPEQDGQRAMMRLARALMLLALGRLEEGWIAYDARSDPALPDAARFDIALPPLTLQAPLKGVQVLVVGEQGLGDEILFASVLPDLLHDLGPSGGLTLAVEPRLKILFARSFPAAHVLAHETRREGGRRIRRVPPTTLSADAWTPMAALMPRFRQDLSAFPDRIGYLKPDLARVAFWRAKLDQAPSGPKVGLTWRSGLLQGERRRHYAPLAAWHEVLSTPGVQWVNVQYALEPGELETVERQLGLQFWRPPGLDLRHDLDDLAALCCALDLTIGCANATTNLAGACGAALWLVLGPGGWPQLGSARYPWYPQARVFALTRFARDGAEPWGPVLSSTAQALKAEFNP
jgi:tetratricopeptide (TPR) repeat protein